MVQPETIPDLTGGKVPDFCSRRPSTHNRMSSPEVLFSHSSMERYKESMFGNPSTFTTMKGHSRCQKDEQETRRMHPDDVDYGSHALESRGLGDRQCQSGESAKAYTQVTEKSRSNLEDQEAERSHPDDSEPAGPNTDTHRAAIPDGLRSRIKQENGPRNESMTSQQTPLYQTSNKSGLPKEHTEVRVACDLPAGLTMGPFPARPFTLGIDLEDMEGREKHISSHTVWVSDHYRIQCLKVSFCSKSLQKSGISLDNVK